MKVITPYVMSALLLAGCANSLSTGTTRLSRELVDKSLVTGKTTKAEVRALLGEPQSITSGDMGAGNSESSCTSCTSCTAVIRCRSTQKLL